MAKFRQGNLVLQSNQLITNENGDPLVNGSGVADFVSLDVSGASVLDSLTVDALSTLSLLKFASGATIDEISIDGTMTGDSDTAVPTEKAVVAYVGTQIGVAVPPGIDEAIVRYHGVNSVQDSGIFITDSNNVTGINNLNVDGTATIATSLFCDDLYVSGDTLFVGTGQIKSTTGNVELYYGNELSVITTDNGFNWGDTGTECRFQYSAAVMFLDCIVDSSLVSIRGTNSSSQLRDLLVGNPDAGVGLYYDDNQKFVTTNTGATVTGILVADGLTLGDNEDITFGAGPDAKISSNGTTLVIENGAGTETMATFSPDGACVLYQNNYPALSTTATGIKIMDSIGDNTFLEFFDDSSNQLGSISMKAGIVNEFAISFSGETLMLGKEDGSVSLYYNNNITLQTTVDGADIRDTSGANAKLNLSASNGTPMAVLQTTSTITNDLWISATQSAGNIYLATQTSSVGIKVEDQGAVEFYYDGAKVGETTANGIEGAVWG